MAFLFGSAARGQTWDGSDLDLAVLLRDNSWEKMSDLMERIARAADVSLDKIDLVDLSKADTILKHQVISQGKILVDRGLEQFLEDVYIKLFDSITLLDLYLKQSSDPLSKEILEAKLMSLDEELDILRRYVLNRDEEQVVEDEIMRRVLRDSLRVGIESAIDICKHIVASKKLGGIREYKDFPLKLAQVGLIPKQLADELADFSKLRNIIVHRYVELDYGLLYRKANQFSKFAEAFREQIMKLIEQS